MTRAEQAALKAYPKSEGIRELKGLSARPIFIKGYEQAEQDLALTWEDVEKIVEIFMEARWSIRRAEKLFKEVLKHFNEWRKGKEI